MDHLEVLSVLARFAEPEARAAAAVVLAERLGVEHLIVYVRDPELGALLPAPGFPQTVTGGPKWREFLGSCLPTMRSHTAEVDFPSRDRLSPAVAYLSENGAALLLVGGVADERVLREVVASLPLLGAIFRAEHQARLSLGEAAVARASGVHAKNLALALDSARGEVERALAESARLNDELTATDRRKDDFMAMLGHELRNPMAAISGAIEVMRSRPGNTAQTERARAIIERQTEQLARLVDDLLDVARITRGKINLRLEVLEVEAIVRRAMEATHAFTESKRHELRVDIRERVHAKADRTRLEQMVTNLLTNAAKYTNAGGHIGIVVGREGDDAYVRVEDDGIGIVPSMLPHIFDAFLQVDPSVDRGAGGLGVGLTVVSRLAALHGGRVDAKSEPGKGSAFTLRLPAVEPSTVSPSSPPAGALAAGSTPKRILVVDDNADTAEMMVMLVESWGHEAKHASDGPSAVEAARELRPDVVLLDIGLPGMDGYEVAARLRDDPRTQAARIIAVSGYGQEADRLKSRAAGCDGHLVKPVNLAELAVALGR